MNVRTFKSNIMDIIWDSVKSYSNVSSHVISSMESKNNGFLFKFHRYGQDFHIHILPHADIHIILKEESHDKQSSIYYVFRPTDEHEMLLDAIGKDLDMLIRDFYNGICYQAFIELDLHISLFRNDVDWREAYSAFRS